MLKRIFFATAIFVSTSNPIFAEDHFGYSKKEQKEWGNAPANAFCKIGKKQSPINIDSKNIITQEYPEIDIDYSSSNFKVLNNGHTIQINFAAGNKIEIEDSEYNLLQMHFHTPSEHSVDGKNAQLESHFVHKDDKGNIAVLAVMLVEGKENSEMAKILQHSPKEIGKEITANGKFHIENFLPTSHDFYHYEGSLTTPPCSENVKWSVFKQEVELSKQQISDFRELYSMNAREIQKLGEREIIFVE